MQNEMTINEIRAMYFDDKALMLSPYPLYRYHFKGDRFYYYINPLEQQPDVKPVVKFAVGVTTLTRKTIPQDEFLTKWIADQGFEAAAAYRDLRAFYGSLMHTCAASLLIKRSFDLDTLAEVVRNYCAVNSVHTNEAAWVDDLKQDVLAFAQFIKDYNVQPIAIELSLVSPRLGVAGTNDLLCEMDCTESGYYGEVYKTGDNKGQPKLSKQTRRVVAIVDFKSGRKSHGGSHNAAQLRLLKMIFEDIYPNATLKIEKLYNWNPKDWRTKPDYTLCDQTEAFSEAAALNLVGLYRELYSDVENKKTLDMSGVILLDLPENIDAQIFNYTTQSIKDIVQKAIDEGTYGQTNYDTAETYFDADTE
jgi:hypothetical protein